MRTQRRSDGKCLAWCAGLVAMLLWGLPACLQAQFSYTVSNAGITITGYTGPGGAVVIPGTLQGLPVTSIGDLAFASCTSLTGIAIPPSVTNIGHSAFSYCTSLTDIAIPNGITYLGYNVLGQCFALTNITLPNSLTDIEQEAFASCTSLSRIAIPKGVTSIGQGAFSGCSSLTNFIIPNSVTNIGWRVFEGCSRLTSITVEALNPAYSSAEGILFDKIGPNLLVCPQGKAGGLSIPFGIVSIGDYAFSECSGLTHVTIPHSVATIGDWAFSGCSGLTTLTIPDSVTILGGAAFCSCDNLTSVIIGSGVTSLNSIWQGTLLPFGSVGTFQGCASLTAITIPNSVTNIGERAFEDCPHLTSVFFNGDAPSVDCSAFNSAPATVYYLPGTSGWGSTVGCRPTAFWQLPYPLLLTTSPNFGKQTNGFGFRVSWATNASMVVEGSSDLDSAAWTALSTNTLVDGWTDFRDPSPATTPAKFYRVRGL